MSFLRTVCIFQTDEHNTSLNGLLGSEGLKVNIYFFVYITGPGVDWEVTHPMFCHLTNINPISLKDWTLCLHMGRDGDYPLLNRCSDKTTRLFPGLKKKKKTTRLLWCLVTLVFLLVLLLVECVFPCGAEYVRRLQKMRHVIAIESFYFERIKYVSWP